jgi:putative ABC transport system permease protein
MMTTFWQDLRYGARIIIKKPGFMLIAVITLALGIGVSTALFTGFNLLLCPWPVRGPHTVVRIECLNGNKNGNVSFLDYAYFRDHAQSFSDLLPSVEEKFLLGEKMSGVAPEEIVGVFVSDNFMSTLGGSMLLGRFFTPDENLVAGRDAVVVLSHQFWQRRFSGNYQIIGQKVPLVLAGVLIAAPVSVTVAWVMKSLPFGLSAIEGLWELP